MSKQPSPTGLAAIINVAAVAPELALLAGVVRVVLSDAQRGDAEAAQWLAGPCCLAFLGWITPDGVDPLVVQQRLMATLPQAPTRDEQAAA